MTSIQVVEEKMSEIELDGEVGEFLQQSESDLPKQYPPAEKSQTPENFKISAEKTLAEVLGDAPLRYVTPLNIPENTSGEIVEVIMPSPSRPRENCQGRIVRRRHNFQ